MSDIIDNFKELVDSSYSNMRKDLLRDKGGQKQKDFLESVRNRESFLNFFDEIPSIGETLPFLSQQLTENEFKEPPSDTEQALYSTWEAVTPALACRSTFWAKVTIEHVREGKIESSYLAANGASMNGAERIDFVLQNGTKQSAQDIDRCVRTVFRSLGGLPEVRGNRSVYVNCPFARAWWRERLVRQATYLHPEAAKSVRNLFRTSQDYWEKFIDRIVFRNSTFGSTNIRGAFVRALAGFIESKSDTELANSKPFQKLCRRISASQGHLELSIFNDEELDRFMTNMIQEAEQN